MTSPLFGLLILDREPAMFSDLPGLAQAWFQCEPDDPRVAVIRVDGESAEYWDSSGVAGVKYLFAMAKALVTGTAAESAIGTHGEISRL